MRVSILVKLARPDQSKMHMLAWPYHDIQKERANGFDRHCDNRAALVGLYILCMPILLGSLGMEWSQEELGTKLVGPSNQTWDTGTGPPTFAVA